MVRLCVLSSVAFCIISIPILQLLVSSLTYRSALVGPVIIIVGFLVSMQGISHSPLLFTPMLEVKFGGKGQVSVTLLVRGVLRLNCIQVQF